MRIRERGGWVFVALAMDEHKLKKRQEKLGKDSYVQLQEAAR